jgi:hypothetical protein
VGRRVLLALYLCSGVGGNLVQLGAAACAPQFFGTTSLGATASGLGLLAAYASMFADRRFTALVLFIVPVSVRGRHLLGIAVGFSLCGITLPADHIPHAAHFGGIFTGMALARYALGRFRSSNSVEVKQSLPKPPQATVSFVTARPAEPKAGTLPKLELESDSPEQLLQRVDSILDKITDRGIHSLTPEERDVLERARARIDQG